MNKTVTDKTTQIKINEVVNVLKPLDKNQNLVTITYPNFMEETFRRKINKILIEMFKH